MGAKLYGGCATHDFEVHMRRSCRPLDFGHMAAIDSKGILGLSGWLLLDVHQMPPVLPQYASGH